MGRKSQYAVDRQLNTKTRSLLATALKRQGYSANCIDDLVDDLDPQESTTRRMFELIVAETIERRPRRRHPYRRTSPGGPEAVELQLNASETAPIASTSRAQIVRGRPEWAEMIAADRQESDAAALRELEMETRLPKPLSENQLLADVEINRSLARLESRRQFQAELGERNRDAWTWANSGDGDDDVHSLASTEPEEPYTHHFAPANPVQSSRNRLAIPVVSSTRTRRMRDRDDVSHQAAPPIRIRGRAADAARRELDDANTAGAW